jgi:hypothetical protein
MCKFIQTSSAAATCVCQAGEELGPVLDGFAKTPLRDEQIYGLLHLLISPAPRVVPFFAATVEREGNVPERQ